MVNDYAFLERLANSDPPYNRERNEQYEAHFKKLYNQRFKNYNRHGKKISNGVQKESKNQKVNTNDDKPV